MPSAPSRVRTPQWGSHAFAITAAIGFALPIVAYFWFLHKYSLNVIFRDQWDDVGLISHSYNGTLGLGTLWAPHNENRIFFPNLIVLLLSRSTHFNIVSEEYLSGVMLVVATGLIIFSHKRRSPSTPWLAYCPIAILMFSFVQYSNTLWGFQLCWYLVLLSLAVAIVLLDRPAFTWLVFTGATAAAILGSFSLLQGLLIWPAGWVLLHSRRRPKKFVLVWLGCAVATGIVYFSGQPVSTTDPYLAIQHPVAALNFFLSAIGDVVGANLGNQGNAVVLIFGILIFIVAIYVLVFFGFRRDESSGTPIGVALICFGLLFAALITEGRISFGLEGAGVSRYTTFDLLILVGCYVSLLDRPHGAQSVDGSTAASGAGDLTGQTMSGSRATHAALRLRIARGVVAAAICVQVAVGVNTGLAGGRSDYAGQVQDARVVVNVRKASNSLLSLTGSFLEPANQIRQLAQVAASHRLSIFNNSGLVAQYAKEGLPVETTPITTVIHPPNGSKVKGTQALFASASGEFGLSSVEFEITGGRLRDSLIGTATNSIYGWYQAWNTTTVPDGAYILRSIAYGATGKIGRSTGITLLVAN
jgi:hypothetical protein